MTPPVYLSPRALDTLYHHLDQPAHLARGSLIGYHDGARAIVVRLSPWEPGYQPSNLDQDWRRQASQTLHRELSLLGLWSVCTLPDDPTASRAVDPGPLALSTEDEERCGPLRLLVEDRTFRVVLRDASGERPWTTDPDVQTDPDARLRRVVVQRDTVDLFDGLHEPRAKSPIGFVLGDQTLSTATVFAALPFDPALGSDLAAQCTRFTAQVRPDLLGVYTAGLTPIDWVLDSDFMRQPRRLVVRWPAHDRPSAYTPQGRPLQVAVSAGSRHRYVPPVEDDPITLAHFRASEF